MVTKQADHKIDAPTFLRVAPEQLLFDPDNPRFGGSKFTIKEQDKIEDYLIGRPNFASELVDSFIENGFIEYEPLVVRPVNDKWMIVEGNRRLAALKHIRRNPGQYSPEAVKRLDLVPVIVFPDSANKSSNKNEIRVYLGVRHLFGFREWPPYSKALFLDTEIKRSGLETIVKEMRLAKDTVRRLVLPFRLLNQASVQLGPNDDFWVLAEALSSTGTKNFISLIFDSSTLTIGSFNRTKFLELIDLLYGKKPSAKDHRDASTKVISETREVKLLAKVLESEKAYKVLSKTRNLDDAAILVDTKAEGLKRLSRLAKTVPRVAAQVTEGIKTIEAAAVKTTASDFSKATTKFLGPKR
jgi:ParB-like nuclease domain